MNNYWVYKFVRRNELMDIKCNFRLFGVGEYVWVKRDTAKGPFSLIIIDSAYKFYKWDIPEARKYLEYYVKITATATIDRLDRKCAENNIA